MLYQEAEDLSTGREIRVAAGFRGTGLIFVPTCPRPTPPESMLSAVPQGLSGAYPGGTGDCSTRRPPTGRALPQDVGGPPGGSVVGGGVRSRRQASAGQQGLGPGDRTHRDTLR